MEHDELGFRVYTANELRDFLIRNGYRECDIAACNCGSWHGGHASDRLRELRDVIGENGKTLLQSATDLENKIADLLAKHDYAIGEWKKEVKVLTEIRANQSHLIKCLQGEVATLKLTKV